MRIGPSPLLIIRRQNTSPLQQEWLTPALAIGRDSANDIVIDHPLASRRHARLEQDENGYIVRDLDSTNGTYVNGERLTAPRQLHNQKGPLPLEVLKRVRAAEEGLRLDSRAKEVYLAGQLIDPPLTVKEFQLLELLYTHKGQVMSKDEIARNVWDYEVYDFNAIDALVYRLRQRVEADPGNPRYIVTVRGFGYKLNLLPGE